MGQVGTTAEAVAHQELHAFGHVEFREVGAVVECFLVDDNLVVELDVNEVVNIDWLCENIEGYIPDISEMRDEAVDLVKIQGVKESTE